MIIIILFFAGVHDEVLPALYAVAVDVISPAK